MSVYFIRLGKYVKVGYSENPERRFRRLFSSTTSYAAPWDCPRGLADRELIGYVSGSRGDEWAAHEALEDFLAGCEFYVAEQPVLDYAARCLRLGRVIHRPVVREDGAVPFVGQIPPGSNPWSLSEMTAARKAAS